MNYQTNPNTVQRAAVEGICRRLGLSSTPVTYPTNGRAPIVELGIREAAQLCVENASSAEKASWSGRSDFVIRAMSTGDFTNILADVASKQLAASYAARPASFTRWASKGDLPNFKPTEICHVTAPGVLPEVLEDDEYKMLSLEDGAESVRLRTYGGMLPITRQVIVNDDLGALVDRSRMLAQSAGLTQATIATGALIQNAVLSDGKTVFHADRGNLLAGASSALSSTSLASGIACMRRFATQSGEPLLIEPKYLVVGPANEMLAYQLVYSESDPTAPNGGAANFFKKVGLEVIVDPLLESSVVSGASAKSWYLLPDPEVVPVVRYYTLGGTGLAPYIESRNAFKNDNIEMKSRIDFAAAPIGSFAVKSTGE